MDYELMGHSPEDGLAIFSRDSDLTTSNVSPLVSQSVSQSVIKTPKHQYISHYIIFQQSTEIDNRLEINNQLEIDNRLDIDNRLEIDKRLKIDNRLERLRSTID